MFKDTLPYMFYVKEYGEKNCSFHDHVYTVTVKDANQ